MNNYQPFETFQFINNAIYGESNRTKYGKLYEVQLKLFRLSTTILKSARTGNISDLGHNLCMLFSWSMASANQGGIKLDDWVWRLFPNVCPYCIDSPCNCRHGGPKRKRTKFPLPRGEKPTTLHGYQEMYRGIYPNNTLLGSACHTAEEAGEFAEDIQSIQHGICRTEEATIELVDLISNIFGVANCGHIHLENQLLDTFKDGCHRCKRVPCQCPYTFAVGSVTVE